MMDIDSGRCLKGPGYSAEPEPEVVSAVPVSIPNADDTWFCERGDFWGTIKQLCVCAKCGKIEHKHRDEARHFGGIFTPQLHVLCDDCFETLPVEQSERAEA